MVAHLINGGKQVEYMAHWLAEGDYDHISKLCGDGYLIAGDSAMFFNILHCEGSKLVMTSGFFAAEAFPFWLKCFYHFYSFPNGFLIYPQYLNTSSMEF